MRRAIGGFGGGSMERLDWRRANGEVGWAVWGGQYGGGQYGQVLRGWGQYGDVIEGGEYGFLVKSAYITTNR